MISCQPRVTLSKTYICKQSALPCAEVWLQGSADWSFAHTWSPLRDLRHKEKGLAVEVCYSEKEKAEG